MFKENFHIEFSKYIKYTFTLNYFHVYEPSYGIPGNYGENEIRIWNFKRGDQYAINYYINELNKNRLFDQNTFYIAPPSSQPGIEKFCHAMNSKNFSGRTFEPFFLKNDQYPTSKSRNVLQKYNGLNVNQNIPRNTITICLVDDVYTSGSTLKACLMHLIDLGHTSVKVLTMARTEGSNPLF
ncbi:MAG: hypothetical protein WC240_01475 [Bacilli bacterium]|jgi:hypothetical protein